MIARRIKELMRSGAVLDKETRQYRSVQYRDIVILTRSIRGWAEVFSSVLAEEGIPAYSVSREGYFETYEVSVLLDYLKILDNARQDLPLAAVLTSPFCGWIQESLQRSVLHIPTFRFTKRLLRMRCRVRRRSGSDADSNAAEDDFKGKYARQRRKTTACETQEISTKQTGLLQRAGSLHAHPRTAAGLLLTEPGMACILPPCRRGAANGKCREH